MSSIVPVPAAPEGEGAGFLALAARTIALSAAALRLKEGTWALQKHMENNAGSARRLSEMCTAAEVDDEYTQQILEVGAALQRVADASGQLSATADTMAGHAQGFNAAHDSEYRGIYEAVNASRHRQAKPGFYKVR
ncbi:conjugal transfer protein TraB [Streptacidiphilus sp. MAP5-52]|uniref:conjugal transfer protein TraB n=1 Tax=Streptacidiphilus sp. MAP5-52 TaxID=3156267 RepID=UPI003518BB5B